MGSGSGISRLPCSCSDANRFDTLSCEASFYLRPRVTEEVLMFCCISLAFAGFIGIDCGLAKGGDYTDDSTGMYYVSDESFIDPGLGSSQQVSSSLLRGAAAVQQYKYLRSFPGATRVCYTLRPSQLSVKFLIRASFLYGNYDGLNSIPSFDLFLGVEKWDTIVLADAATPLVKEIMHIPSSNYTSLCLVSTELGTPFISAIEVRPLKNNTYVTTSGSLDLLRRWNFGSTISRVRYLMF